MTDPQSDETSQAEWLPTVQLPWSSADGRWMITAHWAKVGGRAVIVGIDVRSFHRARVDAPAAPEAIGDDLAEVTQRTLRGISISQVRDTGKASLLTASEVVNMFAHSMPAGHDPGEAHRDRWAAADEEHAEITAVLNAKGEPRQRRPPATEELLRQVAALYTQAVALGDKAPSKYVEDQLREAGEERLSTAGGRVLVRQWVRRARERGYLTIPPGGN